MATAQYTPAPFPCRIVVIQTSGRRGKTLKFERKNWCVLGANKDCDIIVPFPGVAQLQALIHVKRNGVFLQGIDKQIPVRHPRLKKELLDEEEVLILPGDIFLLGNREFLVEYSAEDVCIETNDSIAQALSEKGSGSRKTTPRLRRRRKSSIMVGEFDETYVETTSETEKLLSDTQLARVSRSEVEILPQQEESLPCKEDESLPRHASSPKPCDEEETCSLLLSSDDSAVFSDDQGSVPRVINFESTNTGLQEDESGREGRISAKSAARSKIASEKKQRRNLVFDRLSKGLPATPHRKEKETALNRHESHSKTPVNALSSIGANIAFGKENFPLHITSKSSSEKKDKDTQDNQNDENTKIFRSPLANRVELENQASPPPARTGTPSRKGLLPSVRSRNCAGQTPSRSVAFAASIELAPGAHYSPFRPRKMKSMSGSVTRTKRQTKDKSDKLMPSVTRSMASSSTSRKDAHLSEQPISNLEHVSNSQQPRKAMESEILSMDTHRMVGKPVVEYEDDSYPPTPSSSEEENDIRQTLTVPEPSPMARVGGALAGFLKRLSGKLESDQEDDSSSETDGDDAHKRLSFSEDLKESSEIDMTCTNTKRSPEPVMSSDELQELSQSVPPERRRDFVSQVLSAANDMRELVGTVSFKSNEQSPCADGEVSVLHKTASPEQNMRKRSISGRDSVKPSLQSRGSDSMSDTESQENSGTSIEGEREDTSKDEDSSADDSIGSDGHSSIDPDGTEGPQCSGSTSLEVPGYGSVTPELELDIQVLHNVKVSDELDETDDEDAIERDYGDDPWDDLDVGGGNESEEREVAAVVLDDEVDIKNSGFGSAPAVKKEFESEDEQLQSDNPRDEAEDSSNERIPGYSCSTVELSRDNSGGSSPVDKDSSMSDSPSATGDEMSSAESDLSSTSSGERTYHEPEAGGVRSEVSCPEEKMEGVDKSSNAVNHDELEALMRELSRLKKNELKERLAQRDLDVEGLKKDLVERLARAMMPSAECSGEGENLSESSSQLCQKNDDEMIDLSSPSDLSASHVTPKRAKKQVPTTPSSKLRSSTRRLTRQSLAAEQVAPLSPATPRAVPDAENNVKSTDDPDVSLYRRRTVRELRQFLKNRGLDTQLKMRKDELIQHLISHSIGCDGHDLGGSEASPVAKALTPKVSNTQDQEKTLSKRPLKSSQKLTVAQIRVLLKEQGLCQAGTKKILLERLSAQPERRTRSRRVLDTTSCGLCQAGKICEAATK